MLFYLIYISKAVRLLNEEELTFLLQQSRKNNTSYQITGMLLYLQGLFGTEEEEGRFIQVLEGAEKDVRLIYHKIEEDNRHRNLVILEEDNIEERNFQNWTMGFHATHLEQLKGNPSFFNLDYNFLNYNKDEESNKPLEMLKGFYTIHLDGGSPPQSEEE